MTSVTLLFRQVHPGFMQQGRPTSQVFRPTPKDEDKISVYDGDKITAGAALDHYTKKLGHASEGVLAVTVAECGGLELPVVADPAPFPEHCLIDFSGLAKKVVERKAKVLIHMAIARDWQHPRPSSDNSATAQPKE